MFKKRIPDAKAEFIHCTATGYENLRDSNPVRKKPYAALMSAAMV
jgi:hypothetical protein